MHIKVCLIYRSGGNASNIAAPMLSLKEAKMMQLGSGEKPDYFSANVHMIIHKIMRIGLHNYHL